MEQNNFVMSYFNKELDINNKDRIIDILKWNNSKAIDLTLLEEEKKNIIVKKGDIWTCDLGYNVGSELNKIRPVVVLQNDFLNNDISTVVIAPITSKNKNVSSHIPIKKEDLLYVESDLKGFIMLDQIKTVSKARLGRRIGKIKEKKFFEIKDGLLNLISVNDVINIEKKDRDEGNNKSKHTHFLKKMNKEIKYVFKKILNSY